MFSFKNFPIRLVAFILLNTVGLLLSHRSAAQGQRPNPGGPGGLGMGGGDVVSIYELKLKSGVSTTEFERFVKQIYNRSKDKVMPGVRGYIAKADRGAQQGSYVLVYIFDSVNTRNMMAPANRGNGPNQPSPKPMIDQAFGLQSELSRFVDISSSSYTDYAILR